MKLELLPRLNISVDNGKEFAIYNKKSETNCDKYQTITLLRCNNCHLKWSINSLNLRFGVLKERFYKIFATFRPYFDKILQSFYNFGN